MTRWKDLSPAEKRAAVKEMILAGKNFSEIAGSIRGASRNAVAGIVYRLRQIGELPHSTKQAAGAAGGAVGRAKARMHREQTPKTTSPTLARPPVKSQPLRQAAKIIALPASTSRATVTAMIDAFVAGNGVRRFEHGASNDLDAIRGYLARHGFEIAYTRAGRHSYTVRGGGGRPRSFDRAGLFEFVDGLRIADGKEPFLPRKDHGHGTRA